MLILYYHNDGDMRHLDVQYPFLTDRMFRNRAKRNSHFPTNLRDNVGKNRRDQKTARILDDLAWPDIASNKEHKVCRARERGESLLSQNGAALGTSFKLLDNHGSSKYCDPGIHPPTTYPLKHATNSHIRWEEEEEEEEGRRWWVF